MIKKVIIFCFILNLSYSQKLDKNNRYKYYGTIAGFYAASYLIPDHKPWLSSDTLKQNFTANNTIPTTNLIGYNIGAFTLVTTSIANDYENDPSGLNNFVGHIEALVAEHGVTRFVKKLVQRERPNNGKDKVSFWSGHAAASFTSATYFSNYINDYSGITTAGKWAAGIIGYSYATYVSWTRVDDLQHHTSDVIVGALWGIIASNYIYRIRNNGLHNMFKGKQKKSNKSFSLNFNFKL